LFSYGDIRLGKIFAFWGGKVVRRKEEKFLHLPYNKLRWK